MNQNFNDDTLLARWLNGELTPEELEAFKKRDDYADLVRMIKTADQLEGPAYNEAEEWALLSAKMEAKEAPSKRSAKRISVWVPRLAVAASLLFVIGYFLYPKSPIVSVAVENGETLLHELPDQSTIKLKGPASISYNKKTWTEERNVKFEGEGFFDVEKGAAFQVQTANGSIAVLGTSFNVLTQKELLEVRCFTGKVAVERNGQKQELAPGQGSRSNAAGMLPVFPFFVSDTPSWESGQIVYRDYSLEDVIRELEWQYDLKVESAGLDEDNLSGAFPTDNLDEALRLAFEHLNIKYEIVEEGLVRLSQ